MATTHAESEGSFWRSPREIFTTTDARNIGKLYFVVTFLNVTIAGIYAMLMRTELWNHNGGQIFSTATDYNTAFTMHGSAMFFLGVVPMAAAFGNYLIPRMVASDNEDMYWPKWNNLAFWLLVVGSITMWFSQAPIGWTAYVPLTEHMAGADAWILGLIITGTSSSIGGLNFIMTIWKGRSPGVGWMDMDLFVWSILLYSILLFLTTPVLTVGILFTFFDRNFGTLFYNQNVSTPILYQHLFWYFSHPEVYILVLPAMGLVSHVIKRFSNNEIFGYTSMVGAMAAITILSYSVWAHHMFVTGINPYVRIYFVTMTFIIAIPSGIKVYNWLTTLWAGEISYETPMLFSVMFIIMFMFGGITGVFLDIVPVDLVVHDTYWVLGHFHFIVAAGSLQAMFGALYYYWPELTGKKYHDLTSKLHFIFWTVGNFTTFFAFSALGYMGMPRRYFEYPLKFQTWHRVATVGAYLMGTGFIFFLFSLGYSYIFGEKLDNVNDAFPESAAYSYPEPFAEYVKKETGEEIEVKHSNTWWAFIGAIAICLPIYSLMAFVGSGVFAKKVAGTQIQNPNPTMGYLLLGLFFVTLIAIFYHVITSDEERSLVDRFRPDRHWEIWSVLGSEIFFFGALIGTGLVLRYRSNNWPAGADIQNIPLISLNTFVLITSSFTMVKAVSSIKKGDVDGLKKFLLMTIGLGIVFLSIQAFEYSSLLAEGAVGLSDSATYPLYSSAFFAQTGFHGLHVFIGVLFLILVYFRARHGGYSKDNNEYVEFIGLYWHFVDAVWVVLFTVIYLI